MAYFEFPYSRSYEGDLGYILKILTQLTKDYENFFKYNSIKFADPLQWDITKQYPAYMIVFDYDSGYCFISKKAVPSGIVLTNTDFWCLVGPLIIDADARLEIERILRFVTGIYETGTTATAVRNVGDYVIVSGDLWKVTEPINIGETYGEGFNVTHTTIIGMINDRFPIATADIQDSAVTTDKINDGAVTTDKINDSAVTTAKINDGAVTTDKINDSAVTTAKINDGAVTTAKVSDNAITTAKINNGSVTKQKNAPDKYLFIGDSWNADYHYSWGTKLANNMGLTLATDYWNVAVPGGGMANNMLYTSTKTLVDALTSAQKESITKVLIVSGANDAGYGASAIVTGLNTLETYLVTNLPNADILLVAGQWGFETATFREGLLNAYNTYGENCGVMKFFDKCYLEFMDPYFLESDMIHPTENGQNIFIHTLKNILNGGNYYERKYTDLVSYVQMSSYYGTMSSGGTVWSIKGDISRAGTHVYTEGNDYIVFTGGYWMQYNSPAQIGVIGSNNLFQRKAELKTVASVVYTDNGTDKRVLVPATVIVELNSSNTLDVFLRFDTSIDGNNTRNIKSVYIPLDQMLDFTKT